MISSEDKNKRVRVGLGAVFYIRRREASLIRQQLSRNLEEVKAMGCANIKEKSLVARGNSQCKGPEVETNFTGLNNSREASGAGWELARERVSENEVREIETPNSVGPGSS